MVGFFLRKRFTRVSAVVGIAALLMSATSSSAAPTTDTLYDFVLSNNLVNGDPAKVTSDGALYREPDDAMGSYWNMTMLGDRSFKVTLVDSNGVTLLDINDRPATDYPCVSSAKGSIMYTATNPFIVCYGDVDQTTGFILDYPPYGNATNKTMWQACATVISHDSTTYIMEAPATCLAKVTQIGGGRGAPTWMVSAPFHFESHLQATP